jgi:16S rRNA U1498 N3-methylase RsmE
VRGDVCEERDDIEQLWCGVHRLSPLLHEAARQTGRTLDARVSPFV